MPRSIVIQLPDPCLVVLVGAAGSGKTTFATGHFAADEVLSSDAFRERISGDAADQRATAAAFAALHSELGKRLRAGQLTVVDATSVRRQARRALVERADRAGVAAVAIVLAPPATVVLARNAARAGRVVPEDAVRRHLRDLARSLRDGFGGEGFRSVIVIEGAGDAADVRVERSPG
jgi:predicted kinase